MGFAIGAAVVGTIAGAMISSQAIGDAADTQAGAADRAAQMQWQIYNQQREDARPWTEGGVDALNQLKENNFMGNWQQDPGYEFRVSEGNKAINASLAARGLSNSGAALKSLTKYGQDTASSEYNNAYNRQFNRLSTLAGYGQNANAQNSANGNNYSNNATNSITGAANAQSAGQIAQGNAWSGALTNGANSWMNYQMMNKLFPQGGSANTSTWNQSVNGIA